MSTPLESVNNRLKKGEGWIGHRFTKDADGNKKPSNFLYVSFYRDNKQVWVNSKTNDPEVAYRQLLEARGLVEQGQRLLPSEVGRIRYEDLKRILIEHFRHEAPASLRTGKTGTETFAGMASFDSFFKNIPVTEIRTAKIKEYTQWCRKHGVADATIRRRLTNLRLAFNIALENETINRNDVPVFKMPKDSEAAGTYIYPEDFAKVLTALPTQESISEKNTKVKRGTGLHKGELLRGRVREFHDLRPFFRFLYGTGCRLGAAEKITWKMVRRNKSGEFVIDLPGEIMKTKKPLSLTLTGTLLKPIADDLARRFQVQGGSVLDSTNYRPEWNKACAKAGLRGYDEKTRTRDTEGGARIHDCRCSGAINLLRAGVDESTVLKIGGWKTRAMLDRYNVLDELRIAAGLRKGGDFAANEMVARKTADK